MNDHKSRVERDGKRAKKSETISTGVVAVDSRVSSVTASGYVDDSTTIAGVSFASVLAVQNADDLKTIDERDNDVCIIFQIFCFLSCEYRFLKFKIKLSILFLDILQNPF